MQADHACNFGFIQPSGGFADAFAHCSAIQSFGFMSVEEGQSVEYKIEAGPPKDAVMGDEDLAGNHSLLRLLGFGLHFHYRALSLGQDGRCRTPLSSWDGRILACR